MFEGIREQQNEDLQYVMINLFREMSVEEPECTQVYGATASKVALSFPSLSSFASPGSKTVNVFGTSDST